MFFTKDKIKAFLIHLAISSAIIGIVFAVIFFFWYPRPYFQANGAWSVIRVLVMVDLVMGPLLTLVLFKKGKPGLVFDISMVAFVQIAALVYGVQVIFGERPYYLVFAVDRVEVVGKVEVDANKIKYPDLKIKPNKGPILVFADFPEDKEERNKILFEVVTEGKPDLERRPEYYHPYISNADRVIQKGKSLSLLVGDNKDSKIKVDRFLKRYNGKLEDYLFLPMVGKNNDMALVIDKITGLPVDGIAVDPW
ncbi:MAG: hypothetical protein KJO81_12455 [Gammaproteobacteria bacterium]|nr:hypothetical protein [Gammaproteobacteria bacterium]